MSVIAERPQVLKWGFFGAMAAATLLVIYADERFLVSPADSEWRHIAPFKWLLLPHGLAGAVALLTGPLQFSDRIRANWPRLHRWTGRIYIGAICLVAAPLGLYIGSHYEPRSIHVEPGRALVADDGHRVCLHPQSPDGDAQSVDDAQLRLRLASSSFRRFRTVFTSGIPISCWPICSGRSSSPR
jgi:hypothetical protein